MRSIAPHRAPCGCANQPEECLGNLHRASPVTIPPVRDIAALHAVEPFWNPLAITSWAMDSYFLLSPFMLCVCAYAHLRSSLIDGRSELPIASNSHGVTAAHISKKRIRVLRPIRECSRQRAKLRPSLGKIPTRVTIIAVWPSRLSRACSYPPGAHRPSRLPAPKQRLWPR
jgi:hypothetical protein